MATRHLQIDDFPTTHKSGRKKWYLIPLVALATILVTVAVLLAAKWPFTQARVIQRLQQATATTVQIGSFHEEYFPHPGCVAREVTFRHGTQPLMTIRTLTIRGTFFGL